MKGEDGRKVYENCKDWMYHFLIALSMCIMLYLGYNESRMLMSLMVFGLALPVGLVVKQTSSKYVFVYAYFISELIVDEAYRILF